MKIDTEMPSFEGATEWLNHTAAHALHDAKGHPTLVHFWSVSCDISEANLPQVAELRDQRRKDGLRVIAVHMPRFEAETDTAAVRQALAKLNITEPCAVDNEHKLRDAFVNEQGYVPAYYLFDAQGKLKSFAAGERGLGLLAPALEQELAVVRAALPFCVECQLVLKEGAFFCSLCGQALALPGTAEHEVQKPPPDPGESDPLIGRVLDGKYELTSRVGEGGMSVVYRARRVHIGDEVAVKVLLREFVKDEAAIERFRREARAAAMLRHPNVVTIHDFGETPDLDAPAFIVMEFVEGKSLRDLLRHEPHFSPERTVRLIRNVCAGVSAAHKRGVIHRDIKPDNIIVIAPDEDDEHETVKVVDFGIAKLLDQGRSVTQTGTMVGTPYYMSPEQCRGEPLDPRSDVYSLGAVLYEILTGRPPFIAETVTGVITKHLHDSPAPLAHSLAVPPELAAATMRALAKDPADRPASAAEFARELQTG
jgi:predicted Ser/Thr protein kinase